MNYRDALLGNLRLGWPLMCMRAMEIGTTTYALRKIASFGEDELAASVLIGSAYFLLRGVFAVFFYPSAAKIAKAVHEGAMGEARKVYSSNILLALLFGGGLWLFSSVAVESTLRQLGQSDRYAELTQDFYSKYAPTFIPAFLLVLHQQVSQGLSVKQKKVSWPGLCFTALNRSVLALGCYLSANIDEVGLSYVVSTWVASITFMGWFLFQQSELRKLNVTKQALSNTLSSGLTFFFYALFELGGVMFISIRLGQINDDQAWLASVQPALLYFSFLANLYLQHGQGAANHLAVSQKKDHRNIIFSTAIFNFSLSALFLLVSCLFPDALNKLFLTKEGHLSTGGWLLITRMAGGPGDSIKNSVFSASFAVLGSSTELTAKKTLMLQSMVCFLVAGVPLAYFFEKVAELKGNGVVLGVTVAIWASAVWNLSTIWRHSDPSNGEKDFWTAMLPCQRRDPRSARVQL